MSDDAPDTSKLCPSCGLSEAPTRRSCKVCGGRGLVSPQTWNQWHSHQRARTTSSTIPITVSVEATLKRLRARGTAQTMPLVVVGECLLESIVKDWPNQIDPPTGEERMRVYRRVSDWMTAADSVLRGGR